MSTGVFGAGILVVDDESAAVALLRKILEQAGFTNVSGTTKPHEAVQIIDSNSLDLVLLDLHMPEISGFEILKRIRASEKNDVPVVVLTADETGDAKRKALSAGARDYVSKPFDAEEVLLRISNLLEARLAHVAIEQAKENLEKQVRERTEHLWKALGEVEEARRELRMSQEDTIQRLSKAAEFRDDETSRHIQRMSHYCALLARQSGFDEEQSELIRLASQMHDVGKIGIPDRILLKPGKLTPDERAIIETHCEIGHRILSDSASELLQAAALIALTHHERIDGTGYPHRLAGTEIPIEGRLAAIADVFDALTTDRIYRRAIPLPKSLDIMREGRGSQFDANLLDLFVDSLPEVVTLMSQFRDRKGEVGLRSQLARS